MPEEPTLERDATPGLLCRETTIYAQSTPPYRHTATAYARCPLTPFTTAIRPPLLLATLLILPYFFGQLSGYFFADISFSFSYFRYFQAIIFS
jgi:hypothetical protein